METGLKNASWKRVVLESYPKYFVSPERDITGLGSIVERRTPVLKSVYAASYKAKKGK